MYWVPLSILFVIIPIWCRLDEELTVAPIKSCVKNHCFHQSVEACPRPESKCRCQQLLDCRRAAVCCNLNQFQLMEGLACANISTNGNVEALHIRNVSLDVLNVTQPFWKRLKYMTVTDGRISSVVGEFGRHSMVSCLNLSSNRISKFEDRALVHLYNLSILDLSKNNLSDVPRFKKKGHLTLDISSNEPLLCPNLQDVMKRTDINFMNSDNTSCWSPQMFVWFNSTVKMPLSQVQVRHELNKQCSNSCTCVPKRLDFVIGKPSAFSVMVNCSGQHLYALPSPLPPNTISLNISNNNISSLDIINSDPSYESLRELYADNNQITSILPLEGSRFINHFVALGLRNNKLKTLPTYFLSDIFDRNLLLRQVYLGLNKLHCDCNTAKVLKVWLLTKQKNVPDYDEIYCDNMKIKVIELDSAKLCQSQQDWTDYIYYIIAAEVLLLVCLVMKVSYDYWVFKTAGYLPWPASKMPKLPCDWLCE